MKRLRGENAPGRSRGPAMGLWACCLLVALIGGCPQGTLPDPTTTPEDSSATAERAIVWSELFEVSGVGVLSAVWGSGPDDVFVVGGTSAVGEVYHFDGTEWTGTKTVDVPLLAWVYGFGPDDVFAVGKGGGIIHYDGETWSALDSGTSEDLWGVWGRSAQDFWIVGGTVGNGQPTLLHYDGDKFAPVPVPANDREATSLFKVWGVGSKVFAVGERGLILEFDGQEWFQVFAGAGADEDFVSLWGTDENNIVAVGGRSSARIAVYDGTDWTTRQFGSIPGLNAVYMVDPHEAIVGGVNGYAGRFDPTSGELIEEEAGTDEIIYGMWSDGLGNTYAVGGRFPPPERGMARIRTLGDPGLAAIPPREVPNGVTEEETEEPADDPGVLIDCNNNGVDDADDIAAGVSGDCNADGVPDECEPDVDDDGVPDVCDVCDGFEDSADADDDGVPDGCDVCDGDDNVDTDGDGVPNACDVCPGFPDGDDADGDGVPDGCDACPGFDDADDADGDGTPDGCDNCTGNDGADDDSDGVANTCDICPGFDDLADDDQDGVPNGCDICPGFDDSADDDQDGVPNGCDACPGFDDSDDSDGDGSPAGCDPCPLDANDDSDGDGLCDTHDVCAGFDDNLDEDCDGIPDGCDLTFDPEDEDCDGIPDGCDPVIQPEMEFGFIDANVQYVRLGEGAPFPVFAGAQGFIDSFISFRVTGFAPGAAVSLTRSMTHVATGEQIVFENTYSRTLTEIDECTNELRDHYMFIFASPEDVDGDEVELTATLTDANDSSVTVTLEQGLILDVAIP